MVMFKKSTSNEKDNFTRLNEIKLMIEEKENG